MRLKVPIENILGSAYYHYEITSTDYNPNIDSTITLSVSVKSVFGNPIKDKSVTLYDNDSSVSTSITNSTGIATFSYSFDDWNKHHFNCNNATLDLQASGLKEVSRKTNNVITYILYADESTRTCVIRIESSSSFSIANGEQYTFTGLIPSKYAPKQNLYTDVSRNRNVSFYCWTGGSGGLYNSSSTSQTNQSVSGQITYSY